MIKIKTGLVDEMANSDITLTIYGILMNFSWKKQQGIFRMAEVKSVI